MTLRSALSACGHVMLRWRGESARTRAATTGCADGYPSKPIRLVVPSAPGGGTDIIARMIAHGLYESWGQTVVVDNRGGAGGIPGVATVAKQSAPDGYTMLLGSVGHLSFAPALRRNLGYDPQKDLAPVTLVANQPFVVAVDPVAAGRLDEGARRAREEQARARSRYGSGGSGTASHLGTELLQLTAGISLLHVPYKGTGPAMSAMMSNEIQLSLVGTSAVIPHVKTGRLKALAVTTSKRSAAMPQLPTVAEAGVPGYNFDVWYGMMYPGGTPRAIVMKAHGGDHQAAEDPRSWPSATPPAASSRSPTRPRSSRRSSSASCRAGTRWCRKAKIKVE